MAGDPLWINASGGAPSYTANELRQAMALALTYGGRKLGARQGVRPGGDQLKVTLVSTTITVINGLACVDPGLTTPQGPYWGALPADETHTLTAADPTNPRKDILIVRIYDSDEDLSGLRTFRSEYLVGTPAPSPSEPAVPAGAMKIALIDVPASGGGSAVVTDRRLFTAAAGGIVPVFLDADFAAGVEGRYRDRLDLNYLERDTGSVWEKAADPEMWKAWTSYVPVLTGTGGNPTLGTGGSSTGAFKQYGKTVEDRGFIVWGTGGTGGSGFLEISWPVTPLSNANSLGGFVGAGFVLDNGTNAYPCDIVSSSTTVRRVAITGGSSGQLAATLPFAIGASGDRISWYMRYEVP